MSDAVQSPPVAQIDRDGFFTRARHWLIDDPVAAVALVALAVIVACAVFAPWIAPFDPTMQDYNSMLDGPSAVHLLGTDDLGRDVFSRLIYGARA